MSQPRKSNLYTFAFACAVCMACSIVLALAATALKPKQEANARVDVVKNILSAVGHDFNALSKMPPKKVFDLFAEEFNVTLLDKDNQESERGFMENELAKLGYPEVELADMATGDLVNRFRSRKSLLAHRADKSVEEYDPGYKMVFVHVGKDGIADAYVIPIEGYGLWDIIKGYVALEPDLITIKGITFYEHHETPGLGARITEDWFKDNFQGKHILDDSGNLVSIHVAKGKAESPGPHVVDGISGATLTGNGINNFLLRDLKTYEPYFKTLRSTP